MKPLLIVAATLTLAACGGGSSSNAPGTGPGTPATSTLPAAPVTTPPVTPPVTTAPAQGPATPIAADRVIEPTMVAIPAGSFAWEGAPSRTVKVPAFQMGKFEITVAQWRQFVDATGFRSATKECWKLSGPPYGIELGTHTWDKPPFTQNEFHPVTCVSNIDVHAYLDWLNKLTGKNYRLPSEAEWMHAFRGGQDTLWWGQASQACRYANVRDVDGAAVINPLTRSNGSFPCSDGAVHTAVVGLYLPNPYGLYDMLGNVGEIFDDCEHASYANAPLDGSAWNTGCTNDMLKRRGDSFAAAQFPTPGDPSHYGTDNHAIFEGFRVALSAAPGTVTPATKAFEADLAKAQAAERARISAK